VRLQLRVLAAVSCVTLMACGSDDTSLTGGLTPGSQAMDAEDTALPASTPVPRPEPADLPEIREIEIITMDNLFQPTSFAVRPGERVRFTVVNQGRAPHTFTLRLGDQDVDVSLAAGESQSTRALAIPEASGESPVIRFKCRWHASSDLQHGMVGAIRLTAELPAGSPAVKNRRQPRKTTATIPTRLCYTQLGISGQGRGPTGSSPSRLMAMALLVAACGGGAAQEAPRSASSPTTVGAFPQACATSLTYAVARAFAVAGPDICGGCSRTSSIPNLSGVPFLQVIGLALASDQRVPIL
jgi:plastocyanin